MMRIEAAGLRDERGRTSLHDFELSHIHVIYLCEKKENEKLSVRNVTMGFVFV